LHAQLVIPQPGKENRKTGPIPTAYVARESCPSSCPLLGNGCYAETGNIGLHWRKMKGVPWAKFCLMVAEKLGPRQLWRYAVAGDLPGFGGLIDRAALQLLTTANMRRPVIAYTHKPVLDGAHPAAASNRRFIAEAIEGGLMLNLSGNNPTHADALADLDLAPVVTILPNAYARRHRSLGRGKREWAETIGEYRDRISTLPTRTGGTTDCGVPGELHRNDLRGVWFVRAAPSGDYRLPGAWRLACRRKGHRCSRRATGRAVDLP